jgi:hypothetical protein
MNACRCSACDYLSVWPEMPYMDPPSVPDVWNDSAAQWKVACHWMGPLIDGRAALIRREGLTDGGSIPRAAWPLVGHPFMMPNLPAYLQHDFEFGAEAFPREICDARLRSALIDAKVERGQADIIHDAVRIGGGECWSRHTAASLAYYRSFVRIVGEERWHALAASRVFPSELFELPDIVLA